MQDFLRNNPFGRMAGRTRLFTEADVAALIEALPCPSNSSNATGHPSGISAAPSEASLWTRAQNSDREQAEALRAKREWEIVNRQIGGNRAVATFLEAAVSYMENGGEARYVEALIDHFKATPLFQIGQAEVTLALAAYFRLRPATTTARCSRPSAQS